MKSEKIRKLLKILTITLVGSLYLTLFTNIALANNQLPQPKQGEILIGYFASGSPANLTSLNTLESETGREADIALYYQDWSYGLASSHLNNVINNQSIPLVTWEPWKAGQGVNQQAYRLKNIASGNFDSYIRSYAQKAKDSEVTIWLRPFHEMNGNWYPWCGTVNGNSPQDFVSAWRHVVNIFRQEGANNVLFVWSPNFESVPNTSNNSISNYFPGDNYIDIIGIDGYNWGTTQSWSKWQSFRNGFYNSYNKVTSLSNKPVIIAETGSTEIGGDKATWIRNMFETIHHDFNQIKGLIWFNVNKECDWRIDSSSKSLQAFKDAVKKDYSTNSTNESEPVDNSSSSNSNSNSLSFIIKFNPKTSQTRINQILANFNLKIIGSSLNNYYYYVEAPSSKDINTIKNKLNRLAEVSRVDLNHAYHILGAETETYNSLINNPTQNNLEEKEQSVKAESSISQAANQPHKSSPTV